MPKLLESLLLAKLGKVKYFKNRYNITSLKPQCPQWRNHNGLGRFFGK